MYLSSDPAQPNHVLDLPHRSAPARLQCALPAGVILRFDSRPQLGHCQLEGVCAGRLACNKSALRASFTLSLSLLEELPDELEEG